MYFQLFFIEIIFDLVCALYYERSCLDNEWFYLLEFQ